MKEKKNNLFILCFVDCHFTCLSLPLVLKNLISCHFLVEHQWNITYVQYVKQVVI